MEKIIKIDETHEMKLDNNIGWLLVYKSQFGHDIVPDIMPLISSVVDVLVTLAGVMESGESVQDTLKKIDSADITSALIELASLQMTDFINIIWAMAKTADDGIPEPSRWVRQFDCFPLDVLVPEAGSMIAQGMVSEKNLQSLRSLAKSLQAKSASIQSSLQGQSEG